MSSAGWFARAKLGLELLELLERPDLWVTRDSIAEGISLISDRELRARALELLDKYRRAVVANPLDRDQGPKIRRRGDRRARTDQGREEDARAAQPGNLVK